MSHYDLYNYVIMSVDIEGVMMRHVYLVNLMIYEEKRLNPFS